MKLRIKGDSIRLRLTRSEVESFASQGCVSQAVNFAAGESLTYRLVTDEHSETLSATFTDQVVTVRVPAAQVDPWLKPDSVSLAGSQALPGGGRLQLLVEKDFACLVERAGEDDSDAFAHPAAAQTRGEG